MYRKCVTEISVQHQRQVEAALLELMQKTPYEDVSVTQLCQAAGLSRRVFYHLFTNKAAALYALIDHTILGAESYHPEIPDQALRFFLYWKAQKQLLDALQDNGMTGLLLERMMGITMDEDYDVRHWLRAHDWETGQDILIFNLCGVMGMTFNWYLTGFRKTPEEMAALLVRLMRAPSAE